MNELTSKIGWKTYQFDEMAYEVKDRIDRPVDSGLERYVGLEHLDPESLKIWCWGSTTDVEKQKLLFKSGDIIFGRRNAYLRRVAVADFDGVCSAHAMVLRAKPSVILHELLPFFMQTNAFWEGALKVSAGSMSPTINWSNIAKEKFCLPPIADQKRMSELLWAIDQVFVAKKILAEKLKILRGSVINNVVPSPENETENVALLREVCDIQNGRGFPSENYVDKGIRLLRPGNLGSNGYLDWNPEATKYLPDDYANTAFSYLIHSGDVVMNLTAQSLEDGFIGRVCLTRANDEALLNQRIGRFTCNSRILPEYLFRCFQTIRFRRVVEARCEGTKIKHMYWHHISDYKIVVPELKVQEMIIKQCQTIDNAIFSAEKELKNLVVLRSLFINSILVGNK